MVKRKKKRKTSLLRQQAKQGLITGTSAIGIAALPDSPGTTGIKSGALGGLGVFASTAGVRGALAGTELTARGVGRVLKTTRKLKKRKKKRT